NTTRATVTYTLPLHDALPIFRLHPGGARTAHPPLASPDLEHPAPPAPPPGGPAPRRGGGALRGARPRAARAAGHRVDGEARGTRSEEHTSELQSRENRVCRPL